MSSVSLPGKLLVATPALTDPNFSRTVVLVLDHDDEGTLGVVVNRPTSVGLDEVLPAWAGAVTDPGVLFQGGPVALDSALGLAAISGTAGGQDPLGWQRLNSGLGLIDLDTPSELLAERLVSLRIFVGYAGWGPGQLETELEEGAWYVVEAEPQDAFSPAPDRLWRAVLRRQRDERALVSTYPDDPALN